jgi:hypothetical protein
MHKHKTGIILFGLLLVVISGAFYLANQPSSGRIQVIRPSPSSQSVSDQSVQSEFSGRKISFKYPGSFYLQTNLATESGYIDRVILLGKDSSSKKLAVGVKTTPASSFSDIPAVQFRRLKSVTFSEAPFTLAGVSGLLFTQTADSFEMTGLVIKDGLLITLSLTSNSVGPVSEAELSADFNSLVASWSWK